MELTKREQKVKKYCDNKFGIFMHWGPISGKSINDFDYVHASNDEFEPYLKAFNEATADFSVEGWFELFEKIGAKYFSFVIRHPYNLYYNLYPSEVMPFCSKRDFVGEISASCKKHNIDFVTYQPVDCEGYHNWMQNGYPNYKYEAKRRYGLIKERLREVSQRYQPFAVWLDGWPGNKIALENAGKDPFEFFNFSELAGIAREMDSSTLVGNKEFFPPYIDYICTEQFLCDHFGNIISGATIPSEVCETLPASRIWFANTNDDTMFLTNEELEKQKKIFVKRFFSVVGRGMNYLLNVGPMLDGKIPMVDLEILNYIGQWTNRYAEAIFGTRYCDATSYDWGYMVKRDNLKYLYVIDNADIVEAITCHKDYTGRGFRERASNAQKAPPKWQKHGGISGVNFACDTAPQKITLLNNQKEVPFSYDNNFVCISSEHFMSDDEVLILRIQ